MKKKIVLGILAHVDAGKTTLSRNVAPLAACENLLAGVDRQNAFRYV